MSYNLSDLPIRDGNRRNSQRTEPRTVLSDLPIRDGNPLPPRTAPWPSDFQTFLSGMETRTASWPAWTRPSFQTFLSGMETRGRGTGIRRLRPFRPSYQGWKLPEASMVEAFGEDFQTFLSGMETRLVFPTPLLRALFQTFLSGMETD